MPEETNNQNVPAASAVSVSGIQPQLQAAPMATTAAVQPVAQPSVSSPPVSQPATVQPVQTQHPAMPAPLPAPTPAQPETSAVSQPVTPEQPAASTEPAAAATQSSMSTSKSAPNQQKAPQSVDQTLEKINRGFKERATIERAKQLNIQYINISVTPINPDLLKLLPPETVKAALRHRHPDLSHVTVEVEVCAPCFIDPEGGRLRG